MATTTARKPKKLTRADRENARKAAASAKAPFLTRAGKIASVVVVVAVLVLAAFVGAPVR